MVIGLLCTYCIHQLISAEHELCKRKKVPSMNYVGVTEAALLEGPKCLRRFSSMSRCEDKMSHKLTQLTSLNKIILIDVFQPFCQNFSCGLSVGYLLCLCGLRRIKYQKNHGSTHRGRNWCQINHALSSPSSDFSQLGKLPIYYYQMEHNWLIFIYLNVTD